MAVPKGSTGGTPIRKAAATLDALFIDKDSTRAGVSVQNRSTSAILSIQVGSAVSLTPGTEHWTATLLPGGYWEAPFGCECDNVHGAWDVAEVGAYAMIVPYFQRGS